MSTITEIPDYFLIQVAQISFILEFKNNTTTKICPLCNRQVTYVSGNGINNPLIHKKECAWVLANHLIRNTK